MCLLLFCFFLYNLNFLVCLNLYIYFNKNNICQKYEVLRMDENLMNTIIGILSIVIPIIILIIIIVLIF